MNIPIPQAEREKSMREVNCDPNDEKQRLAYMVGHRDARHKAAEIVIQPQEQ